MTGMFMLLPLLFISVVVVLVFIVFSAKRNAEEKGEDMVNNVYTYLVLFVTLMMLIGGSVGIFMALADIFAPTPFYMSYHDFIMRFQERPSEGAAGTYEYSLPEEEMRERYDSMVQLEQERQRNRATNSLIKSFGWVVIPLPVFLVFQRRLSASKRSIQEE